jgi:hypothetical protein
MVLDHIIDGSGHDGGVISTSFASAPRQGTGNRGKIDWKHLETLETMFFSHEIYIWFS